MMKRFLAGVLAGVIIMGVAMFSIPAIAADLYKIDTTRTLTLKINGREIASDPPPLLINDRTYVPIRFVAEAMNMTVGFEDLTSTAIIENKIPGKFHGRVSYTVDGKTYPDHLAKVYLFPPTGDPIIQEATVAGTFDFGEIEGNEYTVLVVSGNVNGIPGSNVKGFLTEKAYQIEEGKAAALQTVNLFETKKLNQEFAFTESSMKVEVPTHPTSDSKDATDAKFGVSVYKIAQSSKLNSPEPGAVVCLFPPPPVEKWTDTEKVIQAVAGEDGRATFEAIPANTYRILTIAGTLEKTDLSGMYEPYDYDGRDEAKALAFLGEYFQDPVAARTLLAGTKAVVVGDSLDAYAKKDGGMSIGFLVH